MRAVIVAVACLFVSGCAYYLTPRPPVMERKLGSPGSESIGALATAADYRMVYVKIKPGAKICAEPPPDAAGQFAAQFAAAAKSPLKKEAISADTQASLALSMKQLFRRSQGVQLYRDGVFALCNLYVNADISKEQYLAEMQALRLSAQVLIEKEIPYMGEITYDPMTAPAYPPAGKEAGDGKAAPSEETKVEKEQQAGNAVKPS